MKTANAKLKRTFRIVISSILIVILVFTILISSIAKFLIEKYDEQYTGRQIKMGWVYVNPFTGHIHIRNLEIYESESLSELGKSNSVFFSVKELSANLALHKLFSKTIHISKLTLDQPKGTIIQNEKDFNFDDLIKKFTPKKAGMASSPFHLNILGIKIKNGEFHYWEKVIPVKYFIKDVNFESAGKYWNADTIAAKFSFLSGTGIGSAKGNFTINIKNQDYRVAAIVHKFDLKFMEQYLKDIVNYGNFGANLDADMKSIGNFNDAEGVTNTGRLEISDFHLGKNPEDDYLSFDKLVLAIKEMSPKNHIYIYDSVLLGHPYFKYERYDYLDNLQRMFGKNGANISVAKADPARFNLILKIADYIKVLAKNFFKSDYEINKLAIHAGILEFNDYSLTEKFSIEANPFYINADSVNRERKRVEVSFKSVTKPYGNISIALSTNPKDSSDFDIQYHLRSLPVSLFNPYLIAYTSFPLDGGTIELNGIWKVRNGILKSDNHLLVIDPCVTRRIKNKDTKWIPSPLIMSFIREGGNIIDYEIPITGNLKDPKFHLQDLVFDILGNIFVKPATIPYRAQVKFLENEIEKSLTLQWEMRQSSQTPNQEKFVNKMVDFLIKNPEASIVVYPIQYSEKEKEYIKFFEAKKKYFLLSKDKNAQFLSEEDSLKVDKMSIKDSSFVHFLNKQVDDTMLFTIQEKCYSYIGSSLINTRFIELNKEREDVFMAYFKKKNVESRVKIHTAESKIPYNGFSFFKIVYKGELPESLIKAYRKMNELNNIAPRNRFKKERKKNESMI